MTTATSDESFLFESPRYKSLDEQFGEVIAKLLVTYEYRGTTYKSLETKLAAADGDKEAAIKSYMETSEDAQASKLRTQIENLTAKLRDLAEKNVSTTELTEADRERITAEMNSLKEELKAGEKATTDIATMLKLDVDGVAAEITRIGNPAKSARGRKAGEAGSKLPRTSVNVFVSGGNLKDDTRYESFSPLAQVLRVDVADLQKAFAKAAGVEHHDIKSVKEPVSFNFQPHENGAVYKVRTEPKERKPRSSSTTETVEAVSDKTQQDGPVGEPNFSEAGTR